MAEAPEAYQFDDENISVVQPGAKDVPDEKLLETARECPATAILVFDEAGEEVDIFA